MSKITQRPGSRAAEQKQQAQIQTRRKEAEGFINTLENHVKSLDKACKKLQKLGDAAYTQNFLEFQGSVTENLAFIIIIEGRLENLPQVHKDELMKNFDSLVVVVWSIILQGSLSFLTTVSQDEFLPLGSREVFLHELKTLNDAKSKLNEDKYADLLGSRIAKDLETAKRILNEVIEKAPRLLLFS